MPLPSTHTCTADDLTRLRLAAALFGITCDDLVEPVLDAAHEDAAAAYNSGALTELSDAAANDVLHDRADRYAAYVNQGDLNAQLAYLLQVNDYDTVMELLVPPLFRFARALELTRHQRRLLGATRVRRVDQHTIDVRFTLADLPPDETG